MGQTVVLTDVWVKRILEQIVGMSYGVVQITIHDGQIVQIDRTERSRFDGSRSSTHGPKRK